MSGFLRLRIVLWGIAATFFWQAIANNALCAEDDAAVFRAGAATSNITPPLGETVVGGFKPFPCTNIHDELHARCLVLDDGNTKIAIVICDSLGISREIFDRARAFVAAETTMPPANILMAATHTHSATRSSEGWYQGFLARRIADAVRLAINNLEPARIGWGGIDEPSEVFNRRWHVSDPELRKNPFGGIDTVRMNPPRGADSLVKPAGPIDPEVSLLSVQAIDGRPLALLANYSLHYVGGVPQGDVSADYFGIFSQRIGKLLGAQDQERPFVGMLSNGTSGDINNINFREKGQRHAPYEKMTLVADKIARKVAEAHAKIEFRDHVELRTASRELTLKFRKPDDKMRAHFTELLKASDDTPQHHRYERIYAERVDQLDKGPDEVAILLQTLRIGDLAIAAIPFEVFVEIGLDIKQQCPLADAFTIELANGWNSYLPTPEQHELGGYETWMGTSKVQLDASNQIRDVILELMAETMSDN